MHYVRLPNGRRFNFLGKRSGILGLRPGFTIHRGRMLGQGCGEAADGFLIFLEHRPVVTQYFFFNMAEIVQLDWRRTASQHIQNIYTSFSHSRQVIGLWRTTTIFIFSLCVRFYTSYFAKSFLRQAKPLSFLP